MASCCSVSDIISSNDTRLLLHALLGGLAKVVDHVRDLKRAHLLLDQLHLRGGVGAVRAQAQQRRGVRGQQVWEAQPAQRGEGGEVEEEAGAVQTVRQLNRAKQNKQRQRHNT